MATEKNTKNYFSHDSNARNSDKLIRLRMRHKAAGYGVFFMILERLREEKEYMSVKDYNMIAFDLREDASLIKSVIEDFGLFVFTEDGKYFYSESFMKRMRMKDESAVKRSEAGKKGMSSRWNDNNDITMLSESDNNVITKPENSITRKEKESKENNKKESKEKKAATAVRFCPPSLAEVSAYITEKRYHVNAEAFVAFYQSKSWYVGKNKMKDWQAALVTWEKRDKDKAPAAAQCAADSVVAKLREEKQRRQEEEMARAKKEAVTYEEWVRMKQKK